MGDIVENLRRLKAVEEEIEKRQAGDFLRLYNTGEKIHKKQVAFHKCQKRNRWVFGGEPFGEDGVRGGGVRVYGERDSPVSEE
ncbi:MAG: hypothetical protein J6U60_03120 [Clostridia bacterium]|nr:hypothetical protein [Clostridia bacterium]